MRVTAKVTKTGIVVEQDGKEIGRRDESLKARGSHGINLDAAEMALEDEGLGAMHWIWNGEKKHYLALLVRL